MRRSSCLLLALFVFAGCAAEPQERRATSGAASPPDATSRAPAGTTAAAPAPATDAVPVLLQDMDYPIERSDPPEVVRRKRQRAERAMRLVREAATAPHDAAAGCVRDRPTLAADAGTPPLTWMVRRPQVLEVVVLGRQVQVDVRLPEQAPSVACRVMGVTTNVTSGAGAAWRNQVDEHWLLDRNELAGRTVRFVTELPPASRPPYELTVNTVTVTGARSAYERFKLQCPSGGCLPPRDLIRPDATKERFAPTGVTTASLERSLRQMLAGEPSWVRATSVTCATTTRCDVELHDPAAKARVRTTFSILGERHPGCWMALVEHSTTSPRDAAVVPSSSAYGPLGGCVGWTR